MVTKKPVIDEFSGKFSTEVGNFGRFRTDWALNIPLGDTVAMRIAGLPEPLLDTTAQLLCTRVEDDLVVRTSHALAVQPQSAVARVEETVGLVGASRLSDGSGTADTTAGAVGAASSYELVQQSIDQALADHQQ